MEVVTNPLLTPWAWTIRMLELTQQVNVYRLLDPAKRRQFEGAKRFSRRGHRSTRAY